MLRRSTKLLATLLAMSFGFTAVVMIAMGLYALATALSWHRGAAAFLGWPPPSADQASATTGLAHENRPPASV